MRLYNTLSREIEKFIPQKAGEVSLYTCGLTVYSHPHIGNWVAYIYWDVLQRTLEAEGYTVTRVQNITDVGHLTDDEDAGEDKMLKGALREGKTAWEIAEKYIKIAQKEANLLGLTIPTHSPRATDYISQQISFVHALNEKGYAYVIDDGVYFETSKLKDYGKLARLDLDGLQFGARVADTGKKNPTDFALWKFSPKDQQRDMEWDSPWGKGFPGWHLECSTIIKELLGETIDIHTGGIDHIPVHHTNEIAQSETVTGKPLANYWLHANHIKVDGQKMSKSLGNIYTLHDITDRGFSLDAFKIMVLSKHYRTEGNFTWEILEAAQNRLNHWREMAALIWQKERDDTTSESDNTLLKELINNDLGTPQVISSIETLLDGITSGTYGLATLQSIIDFLTQYFNIDISCQDISDSQKQLIKTRQEARIKKDWIISDQLRDKLKEQGIGLNDTPQGTTWYRV
jgi:cysteinyl-tRNA synthetase